MMRIAIAALLAVLPLVHGCAPLIVGGAVAGGAAVANDRRTVGAITEDEGIELRATERIRARYKDGAHVNVTSFNRTVLVTGEVPDEKAKADIERIARGVDNVRSVYNETIVAGVTSLTARSNDSIITSKVKARFVDASKFNALHVKVVTENAVVYLMGMVKKQEAADATEIARTTSGVQKVVRIFEYTN
jgi:osmotically-inducible protein OsmY